MAVLDPILRVAETPPAGDDPPVLTQTITRSHTTITAIVTLGGGPTATPTTTTTSSATPTSTIVPVVATQSSALTGAEIGAIAGAVGGFVALSLILLWCCISAQGRLSGNGTTLTSEEDAVWSSSEGDGSSEHDPWAQRHRRYRYYQQQQRQQQPVAQMRREAPPLVPPPVRIPPTRYTPYRQTRHTQFRGVRRYP